MGSWLCTNTAGGFTTVASLSSHTLWLEASVLGVFSCHRRRRGREDSGVKSALVSHWGQLRHNLLGPPGGRVPRPRLRGTEGEHTATLLLLLIGWPSLQERN